MLRSPLRRHRNETWLRHPPVALRAWLADEGSLTAALQARCRRLSVKVLRQEKSRPHADEVRLLGIRRGHLAWVREVLLLADGQPVVFAHSVLPLECRRGAWRLFAAIGGRPLGAALFADPRIRRGALAFRRLNARHPLWRAAGAGGPLWARRSLFLRHGKPLLVTEVFLPGMTEMGQR